MTTIGRHLNKCYVCGHEANYNVLGSTNRCGAPDLDMRPPEMIRSTMDTWVQYCERCGYSNPDISKGNGNTAKVIKTAKYIKQRSDYVIPQLAKRFLLWQIIAESTGNYNEAGWAALYAAWVCDDKNEISDARHCREKAIDLFNSAKEKGMLFVDDKDTENAILIDLLRRCGQLTEAKAMCERSTEGDPDPVIKNIMLFQIELIDKKDTDAHCCDEISLT